MDLSISCRCEPYRPGSGPQAGPEGAGRGGRPAARSLHANNSFHQSVLDCEWSLLKSRKGLLEGLVRIGELEMYSFIWSPSIFSFIFLNFPLFPSIYQGWPSVSVHPGLPSLLPTQWGILAPPGHQLTFRTQHGPHQPAQRNWVWNKDTALFRWIPGKRQPNVAGSNPRRRYQIWWLLKHVCSRKRFKADLS